MFWVLVGIFLIVCFQCLSNSMSNLYHVKFWHIFRYGQFLSTLLTWIILVVGYRVLYNNLSKFINCALWCFLLFSVFPNCPVSGMTRKIFSVILSTFLVILCFVLYIFRLSCQRWVGLVLFYFPAELFIL